MYASIVTKYGLAILNKAASKDKNAKEQCCAALLNAQMGARFSSQAMSSAIYARHRAVPGMPCNVGGKAETAFPFTAAWQLCA